MDQAYNLILFGGTETAKTHLATALVVAAIHQGKRIRCYKAVDIVKQLTSMDAVILDELGYLPFPASGSALLFNLISHLYEKLSLITTLNFGEWVLVFDNANMTMALLDCIPQHYDMLETSNNSYRFDLNNGKRRWKTNNFTS